MARVVGPLPLVWEAWVECPAPGFGCPAAAGIWGVSLGAVSASVKQSWLHVALSWCSWVNLDITSSPLGPLSWAVSRGIATLTSQRGYVRVPSFCSEQGTQQVLRESGFPSLPAALMWLPWVSVVACVSVVSVRVFVYVLSLAMACF